VSRAGEGATDTKRGPAVLMSLSSFHAGRSGLRVASRPASSPASLARARDERDDRSTAGDGLPSHSPSKRAPDVQRKKELSLVAVLYTERAQH
jgi:hypothetical protein